MLADLDVLSVAIGTLIAAVGTAIAALLKILLPYLKDRNATMQAAKNKAGARDDRIRKDAYQAALDAYQDVIAQHREQAERQNQVIRDQQQAIDALQGAHSDCKEEVAELRQLSYWLHDTARRHAQILRELGRDPGEIPDLPRTRERHEADFLARQAAQSVALAREAAKTLPPVPPTPGTAP